MTRKHMATEKKYLDIDGLMRYDELIKQYIGTEVSTGLASIDSIGEGDIDALFEAPAAS